MVIVRASGLPEPTERKHSSEAPHDTSMAKSKDTNGRVPYTKTNVLLKSHPIDEVRSLKVAMIGAGLSGILGGVLLPAKVLGIE